ncbi:hypothetical protein B566_EDAN004357 [Ephemera danica]|nr:hypothetical protein B566_EDAN004357 [Ephemera danica]
MRTLQQRKSFGVTVPTIPLTGVNILALECQDDLVKQPLPEGVARRKVIEVIRPIFKMVDVFNLYNVEVYIDALGLSIHPDCRGCGLADAMLKARFELCRELGVKITKTVFTGIASQKVGLRCGFKVIKEILLKDIVTSNGDLYFRDFPLLNKVLITVKEIDI